LYKSFNLSTTRDLGVGEKPVIARGIGGKSDLWQKQCNQIVQRFMDYAELASAEGFIIYLKAMHKAGWTDFITLEVSARVWSKEGYDPVQVAALSYSTLNKAFKIASVCRI